MDVVGLILLLFLFVGFQLLVLPLLEEFHFQFYN